MRDLDLIYILLVVIGGAFLALVSGSWSPSTWSPLPNPLYPASYREERERKGGHSEGLGYQDWESPILLYFPIINQNSVTGPTSRQGRLGDRFFLCLPLREN